MASFSWSSARIAPAPSTFQPTDIAGLALWLDASDSNTINGGAITPGGTVTSWTDRSGNSNTATAGGAAITWSSTQINNRGAMSLNGSGYFTLANVLTGANYSLFFVAKSNTGANSGFFGKNAVVGAGDGYFGIITDMTLFDDTTPTQAETDWGISVSAGTAFQYSAISNTIPDNSVGYVNGVLQTVNGTSGSTYVFNIGLIGSRLKNLEGLDGFIGEAIAYNVNLSDANNLRVMNYLNSKWGLV